MSAGDIPEIKVPSKYERLPSRNEKCGKRGCGFSIELKATDLRDKAAGFISISEFLDRKAHESDVYGLIEPIPIQTKPGHSRSWIITEGIKLTPPVLDTPFPTCDEPNPLNVQTETHNPQQGTPGPTLSEYNELLSSSISDGLPHPLETGTVLSGLPNLSPLVAEAEPNPEIMAPIVSFFEQLNLKRNRDGEGMEALQTRKSRKTSE
ncbi:hypothetical protein Ancab_014984 [Ancistrocladus abbreviatus]